MDENTQSASEGKAAEPDAREGRNHRGRFVKGCKPGPGNPFAADVGRRRAKLLREIKDKDIAAAVATLRELIANSNSKDVDRLAAVRELLDRAVGKPITTDVETMIEAIHEKLGELQNERDRVPSRASEDSGPPGRNGDRST